jgi:hypothetical protein
MSIWLRSKMLGKYMAAGVRFYESIWLRRKMLHEYMAEA